MVKGGCEYRAGCRSVLPAATLARITEPGLSGVVVVGVTLDRKGVDLMANEAMTLAVAMGDVALLKKLVSEELDRRCAAIDNIVVQGYGEYIGKRAEGNQEAVKVAVLDLVRSPLALLELKIEALPVEPEPEPEKVEAVEEKKEEEGD